MGNKDENPPKKLKKPPHSTTGPIRWEHAFSADFGPNWHLAYTSDETVKSFQRIRWVEQLMGQNCSEAELRVKADFNYVNYMEFLKSQFKVFDNVIKSMMAGNPSHFPSHLVKSGTPQKIPVKEEEQSDLNKMVDDESRVFLVLNGSLRIEIKHQTKPFVVGSTAAVNDLGSDVSCPDLNLKHVCRSDLSKRHAVVTHGSILTDRGIDKIGWYITNESESSNFIVDGCKVSPNNRVKLSSNSVILLENEVILKFFS